MRGEQSWNMEGVACVAGATKFRKLSDLECRQFGVPIKSGTRLEQSWNKVGTMLEQLWNKVGTKLEQSWNASHFLPGILRSKIGAHFSVNLPLFFQKGH